MPVTILRATAILLAFPFLAGSGQAATPAPIPSGTSTSATRTAAVSPTRAAPTATVPAASATPTPRILSGGGPGPRAADAGAPNLPVAPGVPAAGGGAVAPAAPVQPRAYRTPERVAPPAFVAPQEAAAPSDTGTGAGAVGDTPVMAPRPAAGGGTAAVVFRVSARTAVEGFDLRIGYPRNAGSFVRGGQPAECNAGTGMIVAANDRGTGEMRLLVASAQALPFPIDVFCRFGTEPGASVGAADFSVRVAEVTSDGKRADPGLLLVSVVAR